MTPMKNTYSRRSFLDLGLGSLAAGMLGSLPQAKAAQPTKIDRALVCIFLFGGNDSNNMIVPLSSQDYRSYAGIRGPLALDSASLPQITALKSQAPYGLHPQLAELQALYQRGALAVLANVGPLIQPITKAQYVAGAAPLPTKLFQHCDGQLQYVPYGFATLNWAGRAVNPSRPLASEQIFTFEGGLSLAALERAVIHGNRWENPALKAAMASAPQMRTAFPQSSLGFQLQQVTKLLQVAPAHGLSRPIFFCSFGGFDTHSGQLERQAALLSELSQSMAAFYDATVELGLSRNVTTFTQGDFNRTLAPNGQSGSEHGWGGHQLIMGDSVVGGDVYGAFPTLALGGPDDAGSAGSWIPTSATDQYGATLASWFGVRRSDLTTLFPNLANFAVTDLGFLA